MDTWGDGFGERKRCLVYPPRLSLSVYNVDNVLLFGPWSILEFF